MAAFYESLSAESLEPVYIVVSEEPLLVRRALNTLKDLAVPEALRGFNLETVDGKGATATSISNMAQTLPMMGERRLLVVQRFDALASAELASLVDYLESPNPSTVLLGLCTKVDKRIKFYQRAKKLGFLHELGVPKRLDPWIAEEAKKRGLKVEGQAIKRLADVVGSDLSRLGLALDQLGLYAGDRDITVDDVDDLIADTRERSVFELTDAIASGSELRALRAVDALLDQRQSSIGVVMMLARHMRQLGHCQAGLAAGLGRSELTKRVGAPPFVVEKLSREAEHYSVRAVARSLTLLGEADRSLKGYGDSFTKVLGRQTAERILLESLVRDLIALRR